MEDQREVSTLARAVILPIGRNLYPGDYRPAFASSRFLCRQPCRLSLRSAFPAAGWQRGGLAGLPRSARSTIDGLGSLCPPAGWSVHGRGYDSLATPSSAFLAPA